MSLTLVLGGVRSGKSAYAERLAGDSVVYLATAIGADDELVGRIAAHRSRRPADWKTIEATDRFADRVAGLPTDQTILLDGFGLAVGAALEQPDGRKRILEEIDTLIDSARQRDWIVVSEEVGLAPIALTSLGRAFQDLLGEANQRLAVAASRVTLVIAGRALDLPP